MEIKKLVLSGLGTNCYIVTSGETAVVIDPADSPEYIISSAEKGGVKIEWVLLTHGHFDHTGGAAFIREKCGAKVYIHNNDNEMLTDSVKALAFFTPERGFEPCEADAFVSDGDVLELGGLKFRVLHTPGHTEGSVCYLLTDPDTGENIMFSGDTLFRDSIGRSDTYSGNSGKLFESLEKLSALEDDYRVLPGHGPETKLSTEKKYNPFLSSF